MPTIYVHSSDGKVQTMHLRERGKSVLPAIMRMRDAGSLRAMYDDLERRMALCLVDTLSRARTGDDLGAGNQEGHQFYGNQHTGGIGGPTKHEHTSSVHLALATKKIKSAKMAVHALLVSGHPFSKEELAEAVGMDPKGKTINDYLTNLKNPKFAGPQGALKIEKNAQGHFYVALPNGAQAPPPDTKLDLSKMPDVPKWKKDDLQEPDEMPDLMADPYGDEQMHAMTQQHDPVWQSAVKEGLKASGLSPADVEQVMTNYKQATSSAPAPEPVPAPHAPEPSYDPVQHDVGVSAFAKLAAAAPGSATKQHADDLYNTAMKEALEDMQENLQDGKGLEASALEFKNAKSNAMAAWATAVQGVPFKPTKHVKAFAADMQLAKDIGKGKNKAAALDDWKKNTAAEKAGNFPPKPPLASPNVTMKPVVSPPPAAPAAEPVAPPTATMGAAVPVKPIDYHTMRPKGFVEINQDDIMKGKFKKGILKLKKQLMDESGNSKTNKQSVEHKMRERLTKAPNFQVLLKRLGLHKEGLGSLESKLIGAWAGSSGDSNDISVALQLAVRDAFSIPDSHIEKVALTSLKQHDEKTVIAKGIASLNPNMQPLQPHEVATAHEALKEFVQAQYHETQEHLKELGHDHVYLVRGMKFPVGHDYTTPAAVKLQPASSFSADWETSRGGFTGGGYGTMFICKVPRQQVLSSYLTGFGCTGEHELVVMAHEQTKAYTMPAHSHIATSASAAQDFMQHKMKEANPKLKIAPKTVEDDYGDE